MAVCASRYNDYGACTIAPLAPVLVEVSVVHGRLILSDAKIDLVANQIDLSIRVGWLDDSSLQARRIGTFRQLLLAAPDWPGG